jgi:hypothetical protein
MTDMRPTSQEVGRVCKHRLDAARRNHRASRSMAALANGHDLCQPHNETFELLHLVRRLSTICLLKR